MDIIKAQAEAFIRNKYRNRTISIDHYQTIIDDVKMAAYSIANEFDRTKFVEYILRHNSSEYDKHLIICTKGVNCEKNKGYEAIAYYLKQEINSIGVASVGDVFTTEDKATADSKLDKILDELEKIKDENAIKYMELKKSFEELRELHILGKKKWYEILLGKSAEMVIGGVVSETISKTIFGIAATGAANILNLYNNPILGI